jgi:hypothetical protein
MKYKFLPFCFDEILPKFLQKSPISDLFRHFVLAKFRYGEIFLFGGNSSSKPVLDNGGGVNRCIGLVEKPGFLNQLNPLYLERLHQLAQDYHSVSLMVALLGAMCM